MIEKSKEKQEDEGCKYNIRCKSTRPNNESPNSYKPFNTEIIFSEFENNLDRYSSTTRYYRICTIIGLGIFNLIILYLLELLKCLDSDESRTFFLALVSCGIIFIYKIYYKNMVLKASTDTCYQAYHSLIDTLNDRDIIFSEDLIRLILSESDSYDQLRSYLLNTILIPLVVIIAQFIPNIVCKMGNSSNFGNYVYFMTAVVFVSTIIYANINTLIVLLKKIKTRYLFRMALEQMLYEISITE